MSESNEWQALVKKKMIEISDKVILLADTSKFGVQAFTYFAKLSEVDEIITDGEVEEGMIRQFEEKSVKVKVSP